MPLAQRAVQLAKDTITYLTRLNNTTNLYRRIQVFYHQFLTSAIAVLFLASTHAPLQFSAGCRTEFYMALDLIRDLSARSWVSQRLWRTVRSLKSYAPRLGLGEENGRHYGHDSHHSSSTPASMSTPTPPVSTNANRGPPAARVASAPLPIVAPAPQQVRRQTAEDQKNGLRLQTEISRIFEGYVGRGGGPQNINAMTPMSDSPMATYVSPRVAPMVMAGHGETGDSMYMQFKDMF
jgi:hypothetical protein